MPPDYISIPHVIFYLGLNIHCQIRTEGECFSAFLEIEDHHNFVVNSLVLDRLLT